MDIKILIAYCEDKETEHDGQLPREVKGGYKSGFDIGYTLGLKHAYRSMIEWLEEKEKDV